MRLEAAQADRDAVAEAVERVEADRVLERLLGGDGGPWPGDAGRWLGWVDAPARMASEVGELRAFADEVRRDGLTDVVLLGMGGSSLAPEVLGRVAGPADGLGLHVLDSTHPAAVASLVDRLDLRRTLVIVASKSGGTLEVVSLRALFEELIGDGDRFVAITDPGTPLAEHAAERGYRRTFLGDPEIGGRYSALSPFGLVPAALAGVDLEGLLGRARAADLEEAARLGAALGALAGRGRDKLTFVLSEPFGPLGAWIEQLVAESSGKDGRGILPVVGAPLAAPAVYGEDRVFVAIGRPSRDLGAMALAGHPVVHLDAEDPLDLGAQFMTWEVATAVACSVLGVNAFDQPNVQEAKTLTGETIEAWRAAGGPPDAVPDAESGALAVHAAAGADSVHEALCRLFDGLRPGRYLAVLAYLAPDAETEAALEGVRLTVRGARRCAATLGWGPRYLHSTGQLHKGGPPAGAFLVITGGTQPALEVPGAGYGFDALVRAQAAGDLRALAARGLPALHVDLRGDVHQALDELRRAVERAAAP